MTRQPNLDDRLGGLCPVRPWPDAPHLGWRVQVMLENSEAAFRKSAALLRSCGQQDRARQVERFAGWARFDLDEPLVARQLYSATARLRHVHGLEPLAGQMLEKALSLARADRGNLQLADPASGALRIIAQRGFNAEFLDYSQWLTMTDRPAAGGEARCAAGHHRCDHRSGIRAAPGNRRCVRCPRCSRHRWPTRRAAWSAWFRRTTRGLTLRRLGTCGLSGVTRT